MVSHQGLPLKVDLVCQLMNALVLVDPDHYRNLLRRLAALGRWRLEVPLFLALIACVPICELQSVVRGSILLGFGISAV